MWLMKDGVVSRFVSHYFSVTRNLNPIQWRSGRFLLRLEMKNLWLDVGGFSFGGRHLWQMGCRACFPCMVPIVSASFEWDGWSRWPRIRFLKGSGGFYPA